MIQLGGKTIDSLYLGSEVIKEAYIGSKKVWPDEISIPSAIKDSMVLWYDIKRQGCTNESMANNPVLTDLSGNGYDATCYNFTWATESGITEDNALVSDGVDDYARVTGLPIMTVDKGYTVISKRQWIDPSAGEDNKVFIAKRLAGGSMDGAFTVEKISSGGVSQVASFGSTNTISDITAEIETIYQTSVSYNGVTTVTPGLLEDTDTLNIFRYRDANGEFSSVALYSLLLFDRDLTTEEIEWVINNLIDED